MARRFDNVRLLLWLPGVARSPGEPLSGSAIVTKSPQSSLRQDSFRPDRDCWYASSATDEDFAKAYLLKLVVKVIPDLLEASCAPASCASGRGVSSSDKFASDASDLPSLMDS